MPQGPLGGPRPFTDDNRTILVLIGIDQPEPSNNAQLSLQESVNTTINKALIRRGSGIDLTRQTANLSVEPNLSRQQEDILGASAVHAQQFNIKTELEEVNQRFINAVHNTVVEEVQNAGFNVTGTETTIS